MSSIVLLLALAGAPKDPNVVAGELAWEEKRWEDGSKAFAAAYESTGNRKYLYAYAQCERLAGRCETAVPLYERFLASDPPTEAAQKARSYLAECRALLPPVIDEPPPPTITVPPPDRDPSPPPPRKRVGKDPLAIALAVGGGSFAIAGAALLGIAHQRADRATSASDDRGYIDALDRAHRLEIAGATVLAVGSSMIVGAIVRWSVLEVRAKRKR